MRALVLIAAACVTPQPGPTVVLHVAQPAVWSSDELADVVSGARAWEAIGFAITTEDPGLPECRDGCGLDCAITIGIVRDPNLIRDWGTGALASRETDEIVLDTSVVGHDLALAVAHEVGHILLDTGEHVSSGVMSGRRVRLELTAEDRALACETIKRGC